MARGRHEKEKLNMIRYRYIFAASLSYPYIFIVFYLDTALLSICQVSLPFFDLSDFFSSMAPKSSLREAERRSTPSPSDSSSDSSSSSSSSSKAEQEEQVDEQAHPTKSQSPSPAHVFDKKASFKTSVPTSTPIKPTASSSPSSSSSQADSDSPPKRPGSSPSTKSNKVRVSAPSSAKPSKSKRSREILIELPRKEPKRPKKKIPQYEEECGKRSVEESRKQLFQRIWSEEDEITVLKGMAYYFAKRGCVPYPNGEMNEFHDFIQESLQGQFSRAQLMDKIRRLKKKFENNLSRAKLGGDPTFNKPHEQKSFQLSKRIWGSARNREGVQPSSKSSGKVRRKPKFMKAEEGELQEANGEEGAKGEEVGEREEEEDKEDEEALPRDVKEKNVVKQIKEPKPKPKPQPSKKHSSLVLDVSRAEINESVGMSSALVEAIKMGLGLLSETVKADLKEEWNELMEEEFHVYMKKLALIQAEARWAMDAFKSGNQ